MLCREIRPLKAGPGHGGHVVSRYRTPMEAPELSKRQRYRNAFKAAHPETYKEEKRVSSARARQSHVAREALDPALRAARLVARKARNDACKEARNAYSRAYMARKRAARKAGVGVGSEGA